MGRAFSVSSLAHVHNLPDQLNILSNLRASKLVEAHSLELKIIKHNIQEQSSDHKISQEHGNLQALIRWVTFIKQLDF